MSDRSDEERMEDGDAAVCPECGRVVRVINPRGGDGSARRFVKHGPRLTPCPGSRKFAW